MTLLGAGLMIPAIALLTQRDVARTYPALHPALHALGNPSEQSLVIGGMLARDRAARLLLELAAELEGSTEGQRTNGGRDGVKR